MGSGRGRKFWPRRPHPRHRIHALEPFIPLRLAVFLLFPFDYVDHTMCAECWGFAGYIRGFVLSL